MTHAPILLLFDALACYRLTRLVCADTLTEPLRQWLIGTVQTSDRLLDGLPISVAARPRLADFLGCPWCVSAWCAAGVVLAQSLIPSAWLYASAVLAFSALAGLLSELR